MSPTLQELLNSKSYNSTEGIHIIYTGLLMFNNVENYEEFFRSISEYLEIDNEQLGFQKRSKTGVLWYVRCRANSKQQAHKEIMNYYLCYI